MADEINLSRRRIFARLAKSSEKKRPSTPRARPRPPSAVDELLFITSCRGCGDCAADCPNEVIDLYQGTAWVNLDFNQCAMCGKCVEACPTGALHSALPMRIDLQPSFSTNCNNYLQMDCSACQQACPLQAISIEEGELPVVNSERCNGCGQCRSHCYMGVISMIYSDAFLPKN